MSEPYNCTLTVLCPVSLIDAANHMVNCFESTFPGMPILHADPESEATHVAVNNIACRASWLQRVTSTDPESPGLLMSWQNEAARPYILASIMPAWNAYIEDEEGGGAWLVDEAKVSEALSLTVLGDPEGEVPEGKIVLYPG